MNIAFHLSNLIPNAQLFAKTGCSVASCIKEVLTEAASYAGYGEPAVQEIELPADIRLDRNQNRYHPNDLKLPNPNTAAQKLGKELIRAAEHKYAQIDNPVFRQAMYPVPKGLSHLVEKATQLFNRTQSFSFPINSHAEYIGNRQVGLAHAQGARAEMEDAHVAALCTSIVDGKPLQYELFSIIDGHGGDDTALFVQEHLQEEIERAISKYGISDYGILSALQEAALRLDAMAIRDCISIDDFYHPRYSGAAAVISLKIGSDLWTANIGDCRAILKLGDETIQLSEDAKPDTERFKKGIETRGGQVIWHGCPRVNGRLALARAFNDGSILGNSGHYAVSAKPKISKLSLPSTSSPILLIQACDGIWDVASSQDVTSQIKADASVQQISHQIVQAALKAGSTDNCSALVARLA